MIANGHYGRTKDGQSLIAAPTNLQDAAVASSDKELVARAMWFAGQMIHRGSIEWVDFFETMLECGSHYSPEIGYGTISEIKERLRLGTALQKMMGKEK